MLKDGHWQVKTNVHDLETIGWTNDKGKKDFEGLEQGRRSRD